jgi:hypothetical protein
MIRKPAKVKESDEPEDAIAGNAAAVFGGSVAA